MSGSRPALFNQSEHPSMPPMPIDQQLSHLPLMSRRFSDLAKDNMHLHNSFYFTGGNLPDLTAEKRFYSDSGMSQTNHDLPAPVCPLTGYTVP